LQFFVIEHRHVGVALGHQALLFVAEEVTFFEFGVARLGQFVPHRKEPSWRWSVGKLLIIGAGD
jgi:hypothetical protein